ncbi:MAG: hypothetical protein HOC77_05905 [Chloroflexi bacterium]|nr:hypothetical protein [Chloroflexota bacterium]MBT4072311.1 hypothetical protein [Chloroflexota bacterium]MBT4514609.1 hypothetical protein [Chloroflexota bacterium]MBT5319859.1 hypothetical protein [Chloroflexota bacterium]MBT6682660.1 hypothetical protein [Chloroflexota bacterium]
MTTLLNRMLTACSGGTVTWIRVNVIEIVASVESDEQDSFVVTAVYLP